VVTKSILRLQSILGMAILSGPTYHLPMKRFVLIETLNVEGYIYIYIYIYLDDDSRELRCREVSYVYE
jgi:hypothetical protein